MLVRSQDYQKMLERKKSAEGPTLRKFQNSFCSVRILRCMQCHQTLQKHIIAWFNANFKQKRKVLISIISLWTSWSSIQVWIQIGLSAWLWRTISFGRGTRAAYSIWSRPMNIYSLSNVDSKNHFSMIYIIKRTRKWHVETTVVSWAWEKNCNSAVADH